MKKILEAINRHIPAMCKDWKGWDKLVHLIVCLMLSSVNPLLAVGMAVGKEYGDKNAKGNHWCWWDILADAVGIALGYAVHIWSVGWHCCVCLMW